MTSSPARRLSGHTLVIVLAATAVAVLAIVLFPWMPHVPSGGPVEAYGFAITDASPGLGRVFHPGIILGAASNMSSAIVGGIGVYDLPTDFSLPAGALVQGSPTHPMVTNLTPMVEQYFWEGGLYAVGWNGTGWLVGGQASWGGGNASYGTLVSLQDSSLTNLTPLVGRYFIGGGVFALGWNGTAWLVGGNSSSGVILVSVEGGHVTNLTTSLRWYYARGWIQDISWNGDEWLLGGREVFGTLRGTSFHDLLPGSPFSDNGVWAAGWNGSAWIAGGGAGRIDLVQGDIARPGPSLPRPFDQAVLVVLPVPGGWLVGGKGTTEQGTWAPALVYLRDGVATSEFTDLTGLVPASFTAGEIQAGALAPLFGQHSILLVGEGSYNTATGYGVGALAVLSYSVR